ncbi:hypothetical protein GEMRC1_013778 [Eukaryota sp. GEM-RC1]
MRRLQLSMAAGLKPIPCVLLSLRDDTTAEINAEFLHLTQNSPSFVSVDTEWKPVRVKNPRTPITLDVLQFSSPLFTIIVQTHGVTALPSSISSLLTNSNITKVFKAADEDLKRFSAYFDVTVSPVFDAHELFRHLVFRRGLKDCMRTPSQPQSFLKAVGITTLISKDKSISSSNWANETLSSSQLTYAAFDAWSAAITYDRIRTPNEYLKGSWFNECNKTKLIDSSLVRGRFSSLFDLCQALSKQFGLFAFSIFDQCTSCSFSSGPGDCLDNVHCCDQRRLVFKGVCKCGDTFVFPRDLSRHHQCVQSKKSDKFPCVQCRCGDTVLSDRFGDVCLHVLKSSAHVEISSHLINSDVLGGSPLYETIEELVSNARSSSVLEGVPGKRRAGGLSLGKISRKSYQI